jgi:hypothetical protein
MEHLMAREPQRREQRRTHLDASVVPVERALLARAATLETEEVNGAYRAEIRKAARVAGMGPGESTEITEALVCVVRAAVAEQLRALAEELHFW